MAITSQKLLPSSKSNSSSIVKAKTTKVSASSLTPVGKKFDAMKDKIFEVDKILKGTLAADKKKITDDKKEEEKQRRNKREDKSEEKKKSPEEKKEKGLKLPKIGFLDRIKNFLTTILLGYVVRRLVGNDSVVDGIDKILEGAAAAVEFTADLIIGVLDGLGSFALFVQNKHKEIEEYSRDKFGEDGVKKFKKLSDALFGLINAFLIVSMVKPGKPGKPRSKPKKPVDVPDKPRKPVDVPDKPKKPLSQFELEQQRKKLTQSIIEDSTSVAPKPKAPKKRGGVFGFFGDVKDRVGSFVSEKWKSFSDKVSNIGKSLRSKYNKVTSSVGNAINGMAKNARDAIFNQIIERARPLLDPLTKKAKQVGKVLIENLSKIPGLKNVLNKAGVKSLSNPAEILSKVGKRLGPKVIPVIGGLVNLLFAYDRFSQGDVVGGMIETVSGGLDFAGAFTAGGGSLASTVLDAYMFARDMFPETIVGAEDSIVNKLGLSGLQESASNITKKLPPLSTIVDKFMGGGTEAATTAPTEPATTSIEDDLDPHPTASDNKYSVSSSSSDIVSIGKELARKGFAVAEHPDFTKNPSGGKYTPGQGYVSDVHRGDGHYESRAIDVTQHSGGDPEYKQTYLPVLNSLEKNPKIKMLIHDTWGFYKDGNKSGPGAHGHPEHMHIEVRDAGGKIGKGLFANLGGPEFVIDSDSYMAIEGTLPGFLAALNAADGKQAVKVLENYASYEGMGGETIIVNNIQKVSTSKSKSKSGGSNIIMGGSGVSQTDITYAMG